MPIKNTTAGCSWHIQAVICLFLVGITLAVFYRSFSYDFLNFDDDVYVTANQNVQKGLTLENTLWAFRTTSIAYWHPLTWISHMLDVQVWGVDSGRHHLTNVLFHMTNALLLFLALNHMTGAAWRSAFVAIFFALHPLNVESVAWVAERKNLLSTFFGMLTLLAYGCYTQKPDLIRYLIVGVFFLLGLLAKPMLVTLPFLFLLLDYWPLRRFSLRDSSTGRRNKTSGLILEKLPFLIISGIFVYVSSASIQGSGILRTLKAVPMSLRFSNAVVSYVKYMGKMIWPFNLTLIYPYPQSISEGQFFLSLIFLVAVSVYVIWLLKGHSYLAVGWFWYLGTLVPVSGLVQAGLWPAMADRWAYVPLIGLFIAIVWGIAELADGRPFCKKSIPIFAILIMGFLGATTWVQLGYWKNSIELFRHALEITADNAVAHNNLGNAILHSGKSDQAYEHYAQAIRIIPDFAEAHYNIARILTDQSKIDAALSHYGSAIKSNPRFEKAYYNRGILLAQKGDDSAAILDFSMALRIDPDYAEAHNNLGVVLIRQGRIKEAASHFLKAVQLKSSYSEASQNLQKALNEMKSID